MKKNEEKNITQDFYQLPLLTGCTENFKFIKNEYLPKCQKITEHAQISGFDSLVTVNLFTFFSQFFTQLVY